MSLPQSLPINPQTGYPDPPPGRVWHQYPPDPLHLSDPSWSNTLGQDPIDQFQIFALPPSDQISKIKDLLTEHPNRGLDILFKASAKGKLEIVNALLETGISPIAREDQDQSLVPLHEACFQGWLECAKVLVEMGDVDVNFKDGMGGTPLMRAAWGGRGEVVRWLLARGADVGIRQPDGDVDAFEFGAGSGDMDVVRAILGAGKDMVAVTKKALEAGAGSGNVEMVEFLLDAGGFPRDTEAGERTETGSGSWKGDRLTTEQREAIDDAIPRAAGSEAFPTVRTLLEYLTPLPTRRPLDPETRNAIADGVLNAVANPKCPLDLIELLLDIGFYPTPNSDTQNDNTSPSNKDPSDLPAERLDIANRALFLCGQLPNSTPTAKLLLDRYNANPNHHHPPNHASTLYTAASHGNLELVTLLVQYYKTDIHAGNGKYANGPTALWIAVYKHHVEIVEFLLEMGGPVESVEEEINEETKAVVVGIGRGYRAPVRVKREGEGMRLEYEGGVKWVRGLKGRRGDGELVREGVEMGEGG